MTARTIRWFRGADLRTSGRAPRRLAPGAAALFYARSIGAVVVHAALGLVTYELTNRAALKDWPALLVPIDVGGGVALTAVMALAGKLVHTRFLERGR